LLYLGACLFAMVFMLIAPASRAVIVAAVTDTAEWSARWAPFSYILIAILMAAPVVAIVLIRTWPAHVEPENPMAKYRRDPLDDID
jgi:hypothetical protein